ncbi:MAG: hypothetical protein ACJAUP_002644 [Cellvibrionaceae bacterium]|jgi:hypothetical protein
MAFGHCCANIHYNQNATELGVKCTQEFKMLRGFLAKRKTKKCIISMSRLLSEDYGISKEYTEYQVKTALNKLCYMTELEEVAIGIFCNKSIAKVFGMDEALGFRTLN